MRAPKKPATRCPVCERPVTPIVVDEAGTDDDATSRVPAGWVCECGNESGFSDD